MPDFPSEFLELIRIHDLASLGPEPRATRMPSAEVETQVKGWLRTRGVTEEVRPALMAAALLWQDHLEEAHLLAQEIASTTGSFLHAIVHRREPDYNNARYWFHRVGRHDAFYAIARAAIPLLVLHGEQRLAPRIIPNGLWNPFAFVDMCADARRSESTSSNVPVLQAIQRIEMESLITDLLVTEAVGAGH